MISFFVVAGIYVCKVAVYVPTAFSYGNKVFTCLNAGYKAGTLTISPETDGSFTEENAVARNAARISIFAITSIAQAADLIIEFVAPFPVQLASRVIIGSVDVIGATVEKILQGEEIGWLDGLDILSAVIFRTTDVFHCTINAFPNWRQELRNTMQGFRASASIIGVARKIIGKDELAQIKSIPIAFIQDPVLNTYCCSITETPIRFIYVVLGTELGDEPIYYEKNEIASWMRLHRGESPSKWPEGVPVEEKSLIAWNVVQEHIDKRLKLLLEQSKINDLCERSIIEIKRASGIEDFLLVPPLFLEDKVLNVYKCSISRKPIRFVCIVKGTEGKDFPVCYEKTEISKWITESPLTLPPRWPRDVSLDKTQITPWKSVQTFVNKRLDLLLKDTKRELEGRRSSVEALVPVERQREEIVIDEATTIADLHFIPGDFLGDEILNQYICPIQKEPIRFIWTVSETEAKEEPVYYEKAAILQWILEKSEQLPSGWPAELPLRSESLSEWKPMQRVIDRRLQDLLLEEIDLRAFGAETVFPDVQVERPESPIRLFGKNSPPITLQRIAQVYERTQKMFSSFGKRCKT